MWSEWNLEVADFPQQQHPKLDFLLASVLGYKEKTPICQEISEDFVGLE
jgi:hypothetical protein